MMGYQLSCFVHHQDQDAIEKRLSAFATQGIYPTVEFEKEVYTARQAEEGLAPLLGNFSAFPGHLLG